MSLYHGDCLDVMAGMDPESVDAIVMCQRIGCDHPLPPPVRASGRRRRFCTNACAVQRDAPPVGSGPHPSRHPWPSRAWVTSAVVAGSVIWTYGPTADAAEARMRERLTSGRAVA